MFIFPFNLKWIRSWSLHPRFFFMATSVIMSLVHTTSSSRQHHLLIQWRNLPAIEVRNNHSTPLVVVFVLQSVSVKLKSLIMRLSQVFIPSVIYLMIPIHIHLKLQMSLEKQLKFLSTSICLFYLVWSYSYETKWELDCTHFPFYPPSALCWSKHGDFNSFRSIWSQWWVLNKRADIYVNREEFKEPEIWQVKLININIIRDGYMLIGNLINRSFVLGRNQVSFGFEFRVAIKRECFTDYFSSKYIFLCIAIFLSSKHSKLNVWKFLKYLVYGISKILISSIKYPGIINTNTTPNNSVTRKTHMLHFCLNLSTDIRGLILDSYSLEYIVIKTFQIWWLPGDASGPIRPCNQCQFHV